MNEGAQIEKNLLIEQLVPSDEIFSLRNEKKRRQPTDALKVNMKFSQGYQKFMSYLEKTKAYLESSHYNEFLSFGRDLALRIFLSEQSVGKNDKSKTVKEFVSAFEKKFFNKREINKKQSEFGDISIYYFLKELYEDLNLTEPSSNKKLNAQAAQAEKSPSSPEKQTLLNKEDEEKKKKAPDSRKQENKEKPLSILKFKAKESSTNESSDLLKNLRVTKKDIKIMKRVAKKFLGKSYGKFKHEIRKHLKSKIDQYPNNIKERMRDFLCDEESNAIIKDDLLTGDPCLVADYLIFPSRNKVKRMDINNGAINEFRKGGKELSSVFGASDEEFLVTRDKNKTYVEIYDSLNSKGPAHKISLDQAVLDVIGKTVQRDNRSLTLFAFIFNQGSFAYFELAGKKELIKVSKFKNRIEAQMELKSLAFGSDGHSAALLFKRSNVLYKSNIRSLSEAPTGQEVDLKLDSEIPLGNNDLNCLALSKSGDWLAVGNSAGEIFILNFEKFSAPKIIEPVTTEAVISLNFIAQDTFVLVCKSSKVFLLNPEDGSVFSEVVHGFEGIKDAFQRENKIIVLFNDNSVKVYQGDNFKNFKALPQSCILGDSMTYLSIYKKQEDEDAGDALISNKFGLAAWIDLKKGSIKALFNFDEAIISSAFSKDGKKVVFSFKNGPEKVANLEKQILERQMNPPLKGSLAIFLDSKHLAVVVGKALSIVRIENNSLTVSANEKAQRNPLRGKSIRNLAASNKPLFLALGQGEGVIKILILEGEEDLSFSEKEISLYGHCLPVSFMTFSRDDKKFVSGSQDETIRLVDTGSWNETLVIKAKKNIISLDFNNEGTKLAVSLSSTIKKHDINEIHIYDAINGSRLFQLMIRDFGFNRVVFSPNGKKLITNGLGSRVLISLETESSPEFIVTGHTYSVAVSPDGKQIVSSRGGKIMCIESEDGKKNEEEEEEKDLGIEENEEEEQRIINILKYSISGKMIAAGFNDGCVVIYEPHSFSVKTEIGKEFDTSTLSLTFSNDDEYLVYGCTEGIITIYKINENRRINIKLSKCAFPVRAVFFNPDAESSRTFVISIYNNLKILNINDDLVNQPFSQNSNEITTEPDFSGVDMEINCLVWSNDGKELLTGSDDGVCTLFDFNTRALIHKYALHRGSIWCIALIDGSSKFISGGEDRIMNIVDKITGVIIYRHEMERGRFTWSVAYCAANDLLVTGNDFGVSIFKRFFNSTRILHRKICVLDDSYTPVDIQNDYSVLPYPIQMNRLQLSILKYGDNETRYVDDLIEFYSSKAEDDPVLNSIGSFLYMPDSAGRNAWDYCFDYVERNRYILQSKLVALHLLLPDSTRRFHHLIHNKQKILKLVKSFYLSKLAPMFDSFVSKPISLSLPSVKMLQMSFMGPPFPSSSWIQSELSSFQRKNEDDADLKLFGLPVKPNKANKDKKRSRSLGISKVLPLNFQREKENIIGAGASNSDAAFKQSHGLLPQADASSEDSAGNFIEEHVNYSLRVFQLNEPEALEILDKYHNLPLTDPIFQSDNFKNLIEYFWEDKFEKYFIIRFLIYAAFLIIVCIDFLWVYPMRSKQKFDCSFNGWMIAGIILDVFIILFLITYFLIGEVNQIIRLNKKGDRLRVLKKYLNNVWNVMDLIMIINGVSSASWDIAGIIIRELYQDEDYSKYIKVSYAAFYFSSWMRLLEFARGFKLTSTLIRLLSKVTQDMIGFLLVLFFMLFGFALMAYILQTNYSDHDHWEFIRSFYYILLGDYGDYKGLSPDTSLSKDLFFFILVAVTIIMVILMLNMLIALISESHGDVMKLEKQAAAYEKLQLIIDMKNSMLDTLLRKDYLQEPDFGKYYLAILNSEKSLANKEADANEQISELVKAVSELKKLVRTSSSEQK